MLCAETFQIINVPPGTPLAFEHFLYPGSQEFNLKGNPGGGEFEPKLLRAKYLLGQCLSNACGCLRTWGNLKRKISLL